MSNFVTSTGATSGSEYPAASKQRPHFTEREIKAVREGIDGVKEMLPARCYYDQDIYEFEVEHVLKKNWICVGRRDRAEKPGDYFTSTQFGEPVLIIRDQKEMKCVDVR